MADPQDAGNPVRLIDPFRKIVGVGWGKKPSGGTALIKFRELICTTPGNINDPNDAWGIKLRYQLKDSHGNPGSIIPIDDGIGCMATTVQRSISMPAGFHSFYTDGPSWGAVNDGAYPGSGAGDLTVPGSVPVGTATHDLAGYYMLFENGIGSVLHTGGSSMVVPGYTLGAMGSVLDGAFDGGGTSLLCEGTAGSQFDPGSVSFTYYAFVNLTQIVTDFGGTTGLANVFIDIYGAQYTSNVNVLSAGNPPLIDCKIWENGPTVMGQPGFPKFKGGADADGFARGVIFDDTGPGTLRTDLNFRSTYAHGDLGPGSGMLIKTITWNTSGAPG